MKNHSEQVLRHIPGLRRYARALLANPDAAEDLVQETLARALGKLRLWRPGSNMRAWLFTVMHNQFVNDARRYQNRPDRMAEYCGETVSGHASSETLAHLNDIEAALQQLPEAQREVLLLVTLEGLSYTETATVLRIKKGTVMSRLHRAREHLRKVLLEPPATNVKPIRRLQ